MNENKLTKRQELWLEAHHFERKEYNTVVFVKDLYNVKIYICVNKNGKIISKLKTKKRIIKGTAYMEAYRISLDYAIELIKDFDYFVKNGK